MLKLKKYVKKYGETWKIFQKYTVDGGVVGHSKYYGSYRYEDLLPSCAV